MFGSKYLCCNQIKCYDKDILITEPVHGTMSKHYKLWQMNKETIMDPISMILSWIKALYHRARLDNNKLLNNFLIIFEEIIINTLDNDIITKSLAYELYGSDINFKK